MEPQAHEPALRAARDGASTLRNHSDLKGGNEPSASTEGIDGGRGKSSVGTSNGTHDASVGGAKIGGQPISASVRVGGEPANNDATGARWARTRWTARARDG